MKPAIPERSGGLLKVGVVAEEPAGCDERSPDSPAGSVSPSALQLGLDVEYSPSGRTDVRDLLLEGQCEQAKLRICLSPVDRDFSAG